MAVAGEIADLVDRCPGVFGVYARNLTTRELVDIDADRVLPTESAAKTFILVHYAALVAAGACDPTVRVELKDEDRLLGTGVLRYLASGLSLTLDDLAWLMIVVSDNVATAMLMGTVATPDEVNATMARLGLPTARMNPDITSGRRWRANRSRHPARVISPRPTRTSTSGAVGSSFANST